MKLATILAFVIAFAFGCQPQPEKPYHIASSTDFSNTLVSRKFQTEGLVGLTTDPSDYRLMETIPEGKWAGNTIEFIDSVHFVSAYEAWCGNDCFTSVFGRLTIKNLTKLLISLEKKHSHKVYNFPISTGYTYQQSRFQVVL